jgi:protein-S-isoprenylcysteine O-methyltransferase Ste14
MVSVTRVAAATIAFACLHSLLASLPAKQFARRRAGDRRYRAFYRPFFVAQAGVICAALAWFVLRQPDRVLYRLRGPALLAALSGQAAALAYGYWAAQSVGFARLSGADGLLAYARGQMVPPEQAAQGPDPVGDAMDPTGPFQGSRHPLNLAPIPLLWLMPVMSVNLLTFNALATLYLVLGSLHEEHRHCAAYGDRYRRYQQSGVPFFLPLPHRTLRLGAL